MKTRIAALGVLGLVATAGGAETAHHTPQQIVCAMTGNCAADTLDASRQIKVGDEKAFSLIRSGPMPSAATPAARTPASSHVARAGSSRHAATRVASAAATTAVQPGAGRMDMLVGFDFGSSALTDGGKQEADAFVKALSAPEMASMHFNIEGHTDSVGSRAYNLQLSKQRAQTVVNYLVAQGVAPSRLTAQGYGFDRPRSGLQPNDGGNRRVEFVRN